MTTAAKGIYRLWIDGRQTRSNPDANWVGNRLDWRLLDDKEILAGVRLKFRDLYDQLAGSADPSGALDALLAELPAPKKPH